ncbi:hypothetical protein D9756_009421 [Leucocoprinus leucothites]|uniref:F-box domain-containing protein n=1 Tax=Leucocoprinus leucothites TaxID=201217 RepID=A0A8H5CW75_9AGAR|nr:hypothetical protein D9756_009421 [Leucoagaricus leucothites]
MLLDLPDFTAQAYPEYLDVPHSQLTSSMLESPLRSQPCPPTKFATDLILPDSESTRYLPIPPRIPDKYRSRFSSLDFYREERVRNRNFSQSLIHKLSPDILGTVFEFICLSRPTKAWQRPFCPVVLGSVCWYWHHVAWSTPRVWTRIRLDYTFWRAAGRNRLVNLYVQNSGGMGLHLDIRNAPIADCRGGSLGIPGGDVFDTLFVENPQKLESLEFRVYVNAWLFHIGEISRLGRLINLIRMRVKDSRDLVPVPGTSLSMYNLCALREADFDGLGGPLTCPWTQLTDLTLSVIPSDDAFTAIQYCTNLRSLRCLHLIHQDIWYPDVIPESVITFPYMKKMVWESTVPLSVSWNEALTHWFQFPSLRTLVFNMPITAIKQPSSFLLNLPPSISSLSLQIDPQNLEETQNCIARRLKGVKAANVDILRGVLSSAPPLSTLTLQCDPGFNSESIEMLIPRGCPTDLVATLQELVLVADSPWSPRTFAVLLGVIGSRRVGGFQAIKQLNAVGLVLPTAKCIERWPQAFIDGVRELVEDGLRVTVNVKGEGLVDIDWFAPYQEPEADEDYESSSSGGL